MVHGGVHIVIHAGTSGHNESTGWTDADLILDDDFTDGERIMNEQDSPGVRDGSRYKNKNYYLRNKKGELPPVEYNDLKTEIKRAGL